MAHTMISNEHRYPESNVDTATNSLLQIKVAGADTSLRANEKCGCGRSGRAWACREGWWCYAALLCAPGMKCEADSDNAPERAREYVVGYRCRMNEGDMVS